MEFLDILFVVFGALIAILITIIVEGIRKPHLEIRIPSGDLAYYNYKRDPDNEHEKDIPFENARFLYLELYNKPVPKLFRWMNRQCAYGCQAAIFFYKHTDELVTRMGEPMPVRWRNSLEPEQGAQKLLKQHFSRILPRIDVYPGESERMDVVTKIEEDMEAYGWNNESYFVDRMRNTRYRLPKDNTYLIAAYALSSGNRCMSIFYFENSGAGGSISIREYTDKKIKKDLINKVRADLKAISNQLPPNFARLISF